MNKHDALHVLHLQTVEMMSSSKGLNRLHGSVLTRLQTTCFLLTCVSDVGPHNDCRILLMMRTVAGRYAGQQSLANDQNGTADSTPGL